MVAVWIPPDRPKLAASVAAESLEREAKAGGARGLRGRRVQGREVREAREVVARVKRAERETARSRGDLPARGNARTGERAVRAERRGKERRGQRTSGAAEVYSRRQELPPGRA